MPNFRALGALTPDPRVSGGNPQPPAAGGFAPRPSKQPPIVNFWLRACLTISNTTIARRDFKFMKLHVLTGKHTRSELYNTSSFGQPMGTFLYAKT